MTSRYLSAAGIAIVSISMMSAAVLFVSTATAAALPNDRII
jgi:hypothetical protein